MPIERVRKSMTKATNKIRRHWSREEAHHRRVMADARQMQLLIAMGFQPALVKK